MVTIEMAQGAAAVARLWRAKRLKMQGDDTYHSLCFPDNQKSCFACCPPIRPSGYEHIQYQKSVQRFLRENTQQFDSQEKTVKPIMGFSCWALGYLDEDFRLIGCLLHPAVNGGEDFRHRIDFGEKCSRESCPESKIFSALNDKQQSFWLNLARGLDSFAYSSRKENPLFKLLNWGPKILKLIAGEETGMIFNVPSFFQTYPFFTSQINPKAGAYILNRLINNENIHLLKKKEFKEFFYNILIKLNQSLIRELPDEEKGEYIHRLELDNDFLDFLRLSLKRTKIEIGRAERIKKVTDEILRHLKNDLHKKWL